MSKKILKDLVTDLLAIHQAGTFKNERIIKTPQNVKISLDNGQNALVFCSNNYLGLDNDPRIIKAAKQALDQWGFGLSSVRFICGTQLIHKKLENMLSGFLSTEDTILFSSCFDANGGVFEALLDRHCAIISDELNHASIIDGVRLCKAQRYRYSHSNMNELELCLRQSWDAKYRVIVTDGVFSMDGDVAKLKEICDLADIYDALVMVDDSHATGYLGPHGCGTAELCGVIGRVDIITTTFGKALGGASGGCVSGRKEIIQILRQKSRPYLFSNTLCPAIVGGTIKALEILDDKKLNLPEITMNNARYFRKKITAAGFDVVDGETAIVPVMLYDEPIAVQMADMLLREDIYVVGFTYPVVPKGKARIRVQLSAAHTYADIDRAVDVFIKVGKKLQVI